MDAPNLAPGEYEDKPSAESQERDWQDVENNSREEDDKKSPKSPEIDNGEIIEASQSEYGTALEHKHLRNQTEGNEKRPKSLASKTVSDEAHIFSQSGNQMNTDPGKAAQKKGQDEHMAQRPVSKNGTHHMPSEGLHGSASVRFVRSSDEIEAIQKPLPLSGASSTLTLSHSNPESPALGKSLEKLMVEPQKDVPSEQTDEAPLQVGEDTIKWGVQNIDKSDEEKTPATNIKQVNVSTTLATQGLPQTSWQAPFSSSGPWIIPPVPSASSRNTTPWQLPRGPQQIPQGPQYLPEGLQHVPQGQQQQYIQEKPQYIQHGPHHAPTGPWPAPIEPRQAQRPMVAPDLDAYRATVDRLATNFSHFRNVAATATRHDWSCRIVIYDHIGPSHHLHPRSGFRKRYEPWKGSLAAPSYHEFYSNTRVVPNNCAQRLILVEDFTPSLMNLLGATFQIPPHVFETHLEGSGYDTMTTTKNKATDWHARPSAQGFSSLSWYRPVLPLIPITSLFRARLLRNQKPSLRCFYDGCGRQHSISIETTTNIWRRNLELCPDPGTYFKGSQTEYPVGWEERATIWSRTIDDCNFVILLLDPLPVVTMNESRGALERQIQQRLQVLANLLPRQEVQLPKSRNPQALRPAQTHDVHHGVSHASHSYASPSPYGPQASATVPPSVDHDALGPMPIWPAPGAPSSPLHLPQGTIARTAGYDQSRSTGAKVEFPTPGRSRAALRRRTTQFDIDASDTSDQGDVEEPKVQTHESSINSSNSSVSASLPDQHSITTQAHGPSVPYNPIKARSSSSAEFSDSFSALQIRAYIESLQVPSSTLDDIEYFMQRLSKGKEIEYDPSDALFRVVSDDTHSLIDIIRITLQRIREGILDDDLVEKRVTFWRRLLHRLTVSLSEVNEQLDAFMLFGYNSEAHPFRLASIPILPPRTLADNIKNALSDCVNLLDKSYNLFIAEMQIVNGGRSIAEAESVSKLTELAFVFIPLSFAASLFSMQVKELNKGVSLYIFVAIALGFVLVAYAVRLGIRSSHLVEYQSKVLLQVRDDSELQYNQPIPTHTFIAWASKAMGYTAWQGIKNFVTVFGPLALLLALIAAMLSPIILLWVREISNGFSAVITVLVLLLDGVLIYPVVTVATGRFEPKGLIRELQKNAEANRKKREEKRKRRKEQSSVDPEAPNVESGSESRNRD